jgi:hypothetical protein
MSGKFRLVLVFTLTVFVLQSVSLGQTLPPAIRWIPKDAVISLELSEPKALLELLAGEKATAAITALPLYEKLVSRPQFQEFFNVVKFMETALGTDWRTGLAKLTGGGVTLAVCPENTVLFIIDAEDQNMLERLHEMLLSMARSEAGKQGQPGRVASSQYGDVTVWTFDGKEAHAIIGKRLIFSNHPEGLKATLELRSNTKSASLASNPDFQAAKQETKSGTVATVFADLKLLMQLPNLARLFEQQSKNPLAALAFSGIIESVRDSNWLALGLNIRDNTLAFQATVDGRVVDRNGPAAFALPKRLDEGVLPNISVPRRIAAMSLYRDLHQFYGAKDDLFPERTSGLIFFENMMGIFFSGRDLTNEVLAETKPELRFVLAEQQFDPAIGTPVIKYPAFAVILRLCHPEQFHEVAEEAWQKAVGLINFTRGQQALPGLIIDRPVYKDMKITTAYFSTTEVEDKTKLAQRFNVRPALAMPGEYLILSSTDDLARDLIDALSGEIKQGGKPISQTHSLVEIEGGQLASIMQANRLFMIRDNMIKKGNTQEQAEAGIDMLIAIAKLIKHVELSIGMNKSLTRASLELKLNLQ